jgi:hypothetical protein
MSTEKNVQIVKNFLADGGNFVPRAPRVHSAGGPGSGRRLRYWENQSHKQDVRGLGSVYGIRNSFYQ